MDFHKLLPIFLSLLVISSCNNDPKEIKYEKEHLIGKWELTDAWRNHKRTETLTGTFYEFTSNNTMITNLTPDLSQHEYDYEFDGKIILQKGEPPVVYTLDSLTESTLIFSMSINNFPFKLAMTKTVDADTMRNNEM